MRAIVEAADLAAGLKRISGAVARKDTVPILKYVLIEAEDDILRLVGTDQDVMAQVEIAAADVKPGAHAVDASLALAGVRNAIGAISISLDGSRLRFTRTGGSMDLATMPAEDFPRQQWGGAEVVTEDRHGLLAAIEFASIAMSSEQSRPYLCGVYVGEGFVVATDGHRMHRAEFQSDGKGILPRKMIALIKDGLKCEGAEFRMNDRLWRIDGPGLTFAGKLVDGTFPDHTRVVPLDAPDLFRVNRDDLVEAVKSVSLRPDFTLGLMRADGVNEEAFIEVSTLSHEAKAVAEARAEGCIDDLERFAVNAKYMAETLGALPQGDVQFSKINTSEDVLKITTPANEALTALIMPMRA